MKYIFSIDGGGTKTLGVLYDENGQEVERWLAGPAALNVDLKAVWEAIADLLGKVVAYQPDVILGLSGAETAASASEIPKWIQEEFHFDSYVMSDIKLSYYAHHGFAPGIDVIAGTGSVVMGFTGKEFYMRGGWGARLGDEGSAYGIVRSTVQTVLYHLEEEECMDEVAQILSVFGVQNKAELIQWVYRANRTEFAGMAKEVASLENILVRDVIDAEAEALAKQTSRLLPRLKEPFQIGMTGSVFDKNEAFKKKFQNVLNKIAGKPLVYHQENEENVWGGYRYYASCGI
jgi:N-acetylglucosamine kinase-like BadF-type ATPase